MGRCRLPLSVHSVNNVPSLHAFVRRPPLPATKPVEWLPVLMRDGKDSNVVAPDSIQNRVWEGCNNLAMDVTTNPRRRFRELAHRLDRRFNRCGEPHAQPSLLRFVFVSRIVEFSPGVSTEAVRYRQERRSRMRVKISGPEIPSSPEDSIS